jgi:YidC/Oxa1 family membrane protein insertase
MSNIMDFLLNQPLGWLLGTINQFVGSYGLAIILFTILVKLVLFPLSVHQQKSMAKNAAIQPKMNAIRKKYKNNSQKMNEELMKLMKEEDANPTAGCLPLLIQLPIIYALYRVLTQPLRFIVGMSYDEILGVVEKLQIMGKDGLMTLSEVKINQIPIAQQLFQNIDKFPEYANVTKLDFNFFGINLAQTPSLAFNVLLLIPILAGLSAFASSWYSTHRGPSAAMQTDQTRTMNRTMMITMPLMSVWFTFSLPAGVGMYWIVSNLMMIVQQVALNKMFPVKKEEEPVKKGKSTVVTTENGQVKKPANKGNSTSNKKKKRKKSMVYSEKDENQ